MTFDITAIQNEIEQLDDKLNGIQIDELPCMKLSDFSIFNVAPADLEMARTILVQATRGDKRRAEEMEQALLARIKRELLQVWLKREWLRGYLAGVTSKRK